MRMYVGGPNNTNTASRCSTLLRGRGRIKSATFAVHAPFAYGTLSVEQGTHRLVRISPFDNQSRRQTSFAEVEVFRWWRPPITSTFRRRCARRRLPIQRARWPIGEHHRLGGSAYPHPTGIVVTCQNEKSQLQNKVSAMRVLQAKLMDRKRLEERAELDALKGEGGSSGQPDALLRAAPVSDGQGSADEYEVGNPAAVLDGDIDGFLEADPWRNRRDDD